MLSKQYLIEVIIFPIMMPVDSCPRIFNGCLPIPELSNERHLRGITRIWNTQPFYAGSIWTTVHKSTDFLNHFSIPHLRKMFVLGMVGLISVTAQNDMPLVYKYLLTSTNLNSATAQMHPSCLHNAFIWRNLRKPYVLQFSWRIM